jgi:ADP-heptose:LPS heptosyltransferase
MNANNNHKATLDPIKKTIGILQITRFGDLIQTYQAVHEIKKQYPEYKIILIARSQFARPLSFILNKAFDKTYYLDTKSIFNNAETTGVSNSMKELNVFLSNVSSENFDVLINLSFSKSSNYLAGLITSNHKIGPYIDFQNKTIINDKWSQLLYSTVMRGALNPYSLVDLFKNIIGVKENSKNNRHLSLVKTEKKRNIIVHPFASQERKAWRAEKWVEVIYKALRENEGYTITLVGAKNEILKSQLITDNPLLKSFSHRIINLTGKTSLEELSKEVEHAKLFVGHDSMVGHMAALVGTTTLTISLGNVRPHETTPYHANAYNISPRTKCFPCFPTDTCAYFQCHHDIPYQVISTAVKELIEKNELSSDWAKKSLSNFHISSVNIFKGQMVGGHQRILNLIEGHSDTLEIFRTFYRMSWSFVISDQDENFPFPILNPTTHRDLLNGLTGLQHLFELAEFGKKYSRYILEEISSQTPSVTKIKEFSKKIDEIDQLQKMVEKTSPHLAPIIDYFTIRKGNLFGDNIVTLTESSYYVFEECAQICSILYELSENTISEFKNTYKSTSVRTDNNK